MQGPDSFEEPCGQHDSEIIDRESTKRYSNSNVDHLRIFPTLPFERLTYIGLKH